MNLFIVMGQMKSHKIQCRTLLGKWGGRTKGTATQPWKADAILAGQTMVMGSFRGYQISSFL